MSWLKILMLLIMTITAAIALTATPANASSPLKSAPGVSKYNTPICGTDWTTIHTKRTYFHVYNDDFGSRSRTCVVAEEHHLDFRLSADTGYGFHAYPNISSGWESGRYSCKGSRGPCFKYPVRVSHDGNPVTSMAGWLARGHYDFSWDIWTNRTNDHPVQDDGTELMIWLAHPGVWETPDRTVVIDGIRWDVTTWIVHRNHAIWRLLIYYAARPRSSAYGLQLNRFFADAEKHGEMSADYWLTGIDAGFELVSGGKGDNIHYYSLTGVK